MNFMGWSEGSLGSSGKTVDFGTSKSSLNSSLATYGIFSKSCKLIKPQFYY